MKTTLAQQTPGTQPGKEVSGRPESQGTTGPPGKEPVISTSPRILGDEELEAIRRQSLALGKASPEEIIRWAVETYFPKLAMATAFGPEGCVILSMLAKIEPRVYVFNLDTGYQFQETLDTRERILKEKVPYNPLPDQGYPSVGCRPCTRAIEQGEDERAGRWSGTRKTECGLHTKDE